jgi:hypothetical protein
MSVGKWRAIVDPHFGFLNDRGFALKDDASASTFWVTSAVYASEDRAIAVEHSVEFRRVDVALLRLENGQIPKPQVWVTDAPISRMLLDNVLQARVPDIYDEINRLTGLKEPQLSEQLAARAKALQDVASDFLDGSFAALEDGERVVRKRVEQSPQEIIVWLPNDASAEEERRAVENAQATAPPNVSVTAKRYNHPTS